ncbi:cytochrome c oxidase subunit II [Numidum massiliense]|uniref:cytochrome c oxidase subunit II n=1 Tax=Numidum massiliense TaxID=1522315 RepID=UPI0006D5720B|nr:cytochrome c oxidase subunit II [Numidum massiliense]
MHLHRYERIWLTIGSVTLAVFLAILAFQSFALGMGPPSNTEVIDAKAVETTPPFDQPGIHKIGDKQYEAVIVGLAFGYNPNEIKIPAGSTVHFTMTSKDVVHGFQIAGTNVNAMLTPGYISKISHTFKKPGEYLILCNEYCGTGHQVMMAKVIVQ